MSRTYSHSVTQESSTLRRVGLSVYRELLTPVAPDIKRALAQAGLHYKVQFRGELGEKAMGVTQLKVAESMGLMREVGVEVGSMQERLFREYVSAQHTLEARLAKSALFSTQNSEGMKAAILVLLFDPKAERKLRQEQDEVASIIDDMTGKSGSLSPVTPHISIGKVAGGLTDEEKGNVHDAIREFLPTTVRLKKPTIQAVSIG